jgi:opacity protein-like surface antigen
LTPQSHGVFITAMNRQAFLLAQTFLLAVAACGLAAAPALAADLPSQTQSSLPSLAADPVTQAPSWSGFYVGAGVDAVAFKGAKAQFGGDVYGGYDHRFDNNVVLGVRFSTGYSPWAFPSGPYRGLSFGETDVKLGYAMGRLTPYVVVGAALARPSYGADFGDLSQSVNGLFSGPGAVQAVGTAGVGFDYALTNNVTVGLEARVSNGGPFSPLGPMR